MYWRVARAKEVSASTSWGRWAAAAPSRCGEAAVDDEEEQQHQDEAKVGDDPGDPGQHLLQDPGQAVEVESADRGVELLLGDAELAEPAGGLVEEAGELGLVAGEQRGQPRHRQHQRGGHRQQGSVGDQHGQRHRQPARDAAPLHSRQGMDGDAIVRARKAGPTMPAAPRSPAATTTAPAPPSRTSTARGSGHPPRQPRAVATPLRAPPPPAPAGRRWVMATTWPGGRVAGAAGRFVAGGGHGQASG